MIQVMGNFCRWDGTLSPSDFDASGSALSEKWKEVNTDLPQWLWMPSRTIGASSCNAMGYFAMENVYHHNTREEESCEGSIPAEELVDDATLVHSCKDDMHVYDYHIAYNFNFKVPVLYFRGYQLGMSSIGTASPSSSLYSFPQKLDICADGCPLKLDDIEKDLPAYSIKLLSESKWTFITMEDHPYLHRPWYTLHPCGTSDWMKLLLDPPQLLHYLSAWLSVVGQTLGLRIPLELYKSPLSNPIIVEI